MTFDMDTDDEDDQLQILDVITPPHGSSGAGGSKSLPAAHGFKFGNVPVFASFMTDKYQEGGTGAQSGKSDATSTADATHTAKASVSIHREGQVLQCLELPNQIGNDLYVRSIVPTLNSRFVLVVMAPRCLNRKLELLANNLGEFIDDNNSDNSASREQPAAPSCHYTNGGYLLLYKVVVVKGTAMLSEQPLLISEQLPTVDDAVINCCVLSANDVMSHNDDDELSSQASSVTSATLESDSAPPTGHVVVTTHGGSVKVLNICDFKTVATISPPDGETFINAMFCSGKRCVFVFSRFVLVQIMINVFCFVKKVNDNAREWLALR